VSYAKGFVVLVLPWAMVLLLRWLGPIEYPRLSGDLTAFLSIYVLLSVISYTAGFTISGTSAASGSVAPLARGDWTTIQHIFFKIMVLGAAMFCVAASYDFFIVKGGSLLEVAIMREAENITGPRNSLPGAVVAFLSGAPPVALVMATIRTRLGKQVHWSIFAAIALGFAATFLTGGRNPFFISLAFVFIYRVLYPPQKLRGPRRRRPFLVLAGVLAVSLGFFLSMYLFIERAELTGTAEDMLGHLEGMHPIQIARPAVDSGALSAVYSVLVYLVFYVTHPLTYAEGYLSGSSPLAGGAYSFPLVARTIDIIAGTELFTYAQASLVTPGLYLSLPGSLVIDTGQAGALFLGALFALTWGIGLRNRPALKLCQALSVIYLGTVLLLSPMYAVFGMGNGFPILIQLGALWAMSLGGSAAVQPAGISSREPVSAGSRAR
jgi:hypothetical protein